MLKRSNLGSTIQLFPLSRLIVAWPRLSLCQGSRHHGCAPKPWAMIKLSSKACIIRQSLAVSISHSLSHYLFQTIL
jgi:hypothetical protein